MFSAISSLAAVVLLMNGVSAQSDTVPVTGLLGNATVVKNNPGGVAYVATLTPGGQNHDITGSVLALTSSDNTGVNFQISLSNLPSEGGPFLYHIHNSPVPADGNCTAAGAHVDPYQRGEDPTCDASLPQTCQVGDLAGKHGKIYNQTFSADYVDAYVSTTEGNPSFVGNRSVVVHFANKTRIACANFKLYSQVASNSTVFLNGSSSSSSSSATGSTSAKTGSASSTGKASGAAGGSKTSSSSAMATPTGAGTQVMTDFGSLALLGGLAVFML